MGRDECRDAEEGAVRKAGDEARGDQYRYDGANTVARLPIVNTAIRPISTSFAAPRGQRGDQRAPITTPSA